MLNKLIAISFFVLINMLPLLSFSQCRQWDDKISIITTDNDTIIGFRKDMDYTFYLRSDKVVYKDDNCKKQQINVKKIKFVIHTTNKLVIKYSSNWGYALVRLALDDGTIKYYHGTYIQKTQRTGGHMDMGYYSSQKEVEYHYVEMNNELHKIKHKKRHFLAKMKDLFGDCPKIRKKIDAKEYELFNLYSIIRTYNRWLEKEKGKKNLSE